MSVAAVMCSSQCWSCDDEDYSNGCSSGGEVECSSVDGVKCAVKVADGVNCISGQLAVMIVGSWRMETELDVLAVMVAAPVDWLCV